MTGAAPGPSTQSASRPRRGPRWAVLVPIAALAVWLGYLWWISGVLPSVERYPSGRIKAEGYVKRRAFGEYVRHGRWITFRENGTKESEGFFDLGRKVEPWTHFDAESRPLGIAPAPR